MKKNIAPTDGNRAALKPRENRKIITNITMQVKPKIVSAQAPKRIGRISGVFAIVEPRLLRKAANSKMHQSRCTQVTSHNTNIVLDCFKIPPMLRIPCVFAEASSWLMHPMSRKTDFQGRHRRSVRR